MAVSRHIRTANGFELVYLTPRQKQILALAALERTTEDIARLIDREPKTVENHLASIYQKLHVHSRVGAVLKAMNLGELPNDGDKLLSLAKLDEGTTSHHSRSGLPPSVLRKGSK
jgi:DNA-binding CsgD family transcriptional regulator